MTGRHRVDSLRIKPQPPLVAHPFGPRLIDIGPNELRHRPDHLLVLSVAALGPFLGQISFLHQIGEQLGIRPVGDAQDIVEALCGKAVLVGERILVRARFRGVQLITIGDAGDQSPRIAFGELQEKEA